MPTRYFPRLIDRELEDVFPDLPAISIEGVRGCGKTSTALQIAKTVYRLDEDSHLQQVRANPRRAAHSQPPVLFDEWQRYPQIWDVVRREVDDGAAAGSFLLTGSAAPKAGSTTHTGAGRIVGIRMRPMTLAERGVVTPAVSLSQMLESKAFSTEIFGRTKMTAQEYAEQIVCSGLPAIFPKNSRLWRRELQSYLDRAVDVELREGDYPIRDIFALKTWLTAYARHVGTAAKYNKILDSATATDGVQPTSKTTLRYRNALQNLWLLDPLEPWNSPSTKIARVSSSPVHHLADPALAARLLDLDVDDLLLPESGKRFGQLFESLAVLCVRCIAEHRGWQARSLRTRDGDHEVDIVVQASASRIIGIEVKLSTSITDDDVKHLRWFSRQLGPACRDLVVLYAGETAYRRVEDNIAVIPLACLGD